MTLGQILNDLKISASQTLSLYVDLPDLRTGFKNTH